MKLVLTTLNAKYIHSSLAIRYLKMYCHKICSDIVIKEYTINNEILNILGDLYAEKPDIIGLACYIWNIETTLALVRLLKKVLPQAVIVLGGPEVSHEAAAIMRQNPGINFIIQGEGEEALANLLRALQSGEKTFPIPGLTWRSNEVIIESQPQVVSNLDLLKFPYDQNEIVELKDKIIYYESSRGCPYSCNYCLSSATTGVRFFNLNRVLAELDFFVRNNVRQVKFVDRTFNAKKEHYLPILKYLASANCETNFHFEIAADLLDDEILDFLKTVPPKRFQFEIGVQSTNDCTLKDVNRKNDWPKIVRNVETLKVNRNIHLHLDLIAGLPFEDLWRFGQSFNDVYSLRPDMLQLGFLKLLKGSIIRMDAEQHGYLYTDHAPYEVLANNYIKYTDIRRLKIIEALFDQIYNSGRFRATLEWLVYTYNNDAFRLFHDLAVYWEERGLHLVAHSPKNIYRYIYDFCCCCRKQQYVDFCLEFMKFDACNSESGAVRPEFLPWHGDEWADIENAFWRDEIRVSKYLPNYKFSTWRDVRKNYLIEVFHLNIPAFLQGQSEISQQQIVLLFSLKNPVGYQIIEQSDFHS